MARARCQRSEAAFLTAYADSLERVQNLKGTSMQITRETAAALRDRAATASSSQGLEEWLREKEAALLAALRQDMGATAVAKIEAEVDTDVSPYASRMPARVLDQIRTQSVARRILEVHGLGRLSLFHL
jgi:hypothetical protein